MTLTARCSSPSASAWRTKEDNPSQVVRKRRQRSVARQSCSREQPTGLFGSCGTRFVNAAGVSAWGVAYLFIKIDASCDIAFLEGNNDRREERHSRSGARVLRQDVGRLRRLEDQRMLLRDRAPAEVRARRDARHRRRDRRALLRMRLSDSAGTYRRDGGRFGLRHGARCVCALEARGADRARHRRRHDPRAACRCAEIPRRASGKVRVRTFKRGV